MKHLKGILILLIISINFSGCIGYISLLWEKPDNTDDFYKAYDLLFPRYSYSYGKTEKPNYNEALKILDNIFTDYNGIYQIYYIKPNVLYLMGCINIKFAEIYNSDSYYEKAIEKFDLSVQYIGLKGQDNLYNTKVAPYYYMTKNDSDRMVYQKERLIALNYGQKAFAKMKLGDYEKSIKDLEYCVYNFPSEENKKDFEQYYYFSAYGYEQNNYSWESEHQLFFDRHPYYYLALLYYKLEKFDESLEYISNILNRINFYSDEEKLKKIESARIFIGEIFLLSGDIRLKLDEKTKACEDYKKSLEFGNVKAYDKLKENNCIKKN